MFCNFFFNFYSDWDIGTPVNLGGMTGRALAVILKLIFFKSCDHQKVLLFAKVVGFGRDTLYISIN
jgi:hypothetical protein